MTPPLLGWTRPSVDSINAAYLEAGNDPGPLRKAEDAGLGLTSCLKEEGPRLRHRVVTPDPQRGLEGRTQGPKTFPKLSGLYQSPKSIKKLFGYASITQAVKTLPNLITTKTFHIWEDSYIYKRALSPHLQGSETHYITETKFPPPY